MDDHEHLGLAEVAARIGVSGTRVLQLMRERDDFPVPVAELAMGKVWHGADVDNWLIAHPVRRPGRPRRTFP